MDDFVVVFEKDQSAKGGYGIRTMCYYQSREEFDLIYPKEGMGEIIIASGITKDEAQDLCCLTPEICRLMGAVESTFSHTSSDLSTEDYLLYLTMEINKARFAIGVDRERIRERHLENRRYNATKYLQFFQQMMRDMPSGMKYTAMAAALIKCRNTSGQVNL